MKKSEIVVGGFYRAKISGVVVTVKVLDIGRREPTAYRSGGTYYDVRNAKTGREVTFKSAMRFRGVADDPESF